jgi:hypothetical protein
MDMVVKVMVTVVNVGMIMVVVIMLVPLEQMVMMEDKVLKWLVKVMQQAEQIVVLSMVVDFSVSSLTTWGTDTVYLFLWTCQKGKGKGKYVCAAPP